jgi:hypothetical protein
MKCDWIAPVLVLLAGALILPQHGAAKPNYTKKERKACEFCHVGSWDSGKYSKPGEYYQVHHSLQGYKEETAPAPRRPGYENAPAHDKQGGKK